MIKNAILVMLSIIFLVTAGSLTYVFYYNTKAQIAEDKEKYKAEMPKKEEPNTIKRQMEAKSKEKAEKEKAKKEAEQRGNKIDAEDATSEDVAYLVQDMYVTPLSGSDRAYEYEEHEDDAGIFLHPYVIERKGTTVTLHLKAGNRGDNQMNFDAITVKCDSGEKQLRFQGSPSVTNKSGLVVSFYDAQAAGDMENIMHAIAGSNFVQVAISGHEEENKILSPAEIARFKNIMKLYDTLRGD